jgi:hypothetical protein
VDRLDLLVGRSQRQVGDLRAVHERDRREGRVGERRTDDGVDAVLQLVEREHRLIGRALVVLEVQFDLAAEHAAVVVDLLDGQLDGLLVLGAERRVVTGQRQDEAELDRGVGALVRGGVVAA